MDYENLIPGAQFIEIPKPKGPKDVIIFVEPAKPPTPEQQRDLENLIPACSYATMRQQYDGGYVVQELPNLPIPAPARLAPTLRYLGATYWEGADGYYTARDGHKQRFTDFRMRIEAKEVLKKLDGTTLVSYRVVLTDEHGDSHVIKVAEDAWGDLPSLIEKHAPVCQIFSDELSNCRERFRRLAGVLLKAAKFRTVEIRESWGWGEPSSDGSRRFYHGGLDTCSSQKKLLPRLHDADLHGHCLQNALRMWEAGPYEVTAPAILYCLAAYMDAIFTDAGYPLAHCLMFIGPSGYLKTTFMRELYAPFVPKPQRLFTVRSTPASMNVLHEQAFDDVLAIDDFNREGRPADVEKKMKVIRDLIRTYSDKTPRAKYGGNHDVKQYALRGGCVFTGETSMTGQLKSGELRYLRVFLKAPLEKAVLGWFNENASTWPYFVSCWIRFLEARYTALLTMIRQEFPVRREKAEIREPRLIDTWVHLTLTADVMAEFLLSETILSREEVVFWRNNAQQALLAVIKRQEEAAQVQEPWLVYLEEIFNLIGTGRLVIAPDISVYVSDLTRYAGYKEESLTFLKKDEVFKAVMEAAWSRNETIPIGVDEVSKRFKEEGLTRCDAGSCLKKASSRIPGRPRMLALNTVACRKILKEDSL